MLVDDQRHVRAALLQLLQQVADLLRLGHEVHRVQDLPQHHRLPPLQQPQHVLDVDEADHVVRRGVVDGDARCSRPPRSGAPPRPAASWRRGRRSSGRGTMTFFTGVSENSKTLWISSSSVWSSTPWCRPWVTRYLISSSETNVRWPMSRTRSTQSTARVERVRIDDQPLRQLRHPPQRRGGDEGDGVGEPEGQRLGDQLAEDQLEVDDPAADQDRGQHGRGQVLAEEARLQRRLDVAAGQVPAGHPGQRPHQGDADLDRGQEPVHVVLEAPSGAGRPGGPRPPGRRSGSAARR